MRTKDVIGQAMLIAFLVVCVWWTLPPAAFQSADERERIEQSVTYSGCNEVRALGKAPVYAGQPGYRPEMDGDADGIACEPVRR